MAKEPIEPQDVQEVMTQSGEGSGLVVANIPTEVLDVQIVTDKLAKINEVDFSTGINGNALYWEVVKEGEQLTGVFRGWKLLTKTEDGVTKNIPAVVIATETGEYLCGSIVIVEAFAGRATGCYAQITYKGKKGRAKMFEIKIV
jgi:hypothetical protein